MLLYLLSSSIVHARYSLLLFLSDGSIVLCMPDYLLMYSRGDEKKIQVGCMGNEFICVLCCLHSFVVYILIRLFLKFSSVLWPVRAWYHRWNIWVNSRENMFVFDCFKAHVSVNFVNIQTFVRCYIWMCLFHKVFLFLKSFVRFKVSGLISYIFIEERQVNGAKLGAFLGWLQKVVILNPFKKWWF